MTARTPPELWAAWDGRRQPMLRRLEGYAGLTIPRMMEPLGSDEQNSTVNRDHQSLGAQGANHLTNKLMLTMFAPSRPFIRLDIDAAMKATMVAQGIPAEDLEIALFDSELKAVRALDNRGARPKIYEGLLNLLVTGNVLMHLPEKADPSMYSVREYVVRRNRKGEWRKIILCREHQFQDLEDDIQTFLTTKKPQGYNPDTPVKLFTHIWREGSRVKEQLWTKDGEVELPDYSGNYALADSPWHPEVWNLRSGAHYGTGHVEDFSGDLAALSILSKAQIDAAILASEFRWLLRPGAQTSAEEMETSANGAVLPGEKDDLYLLHANTAGALESVRKTAEDYVRRIGYGFLLNAAVTRDAERVTRAEIQQQAMELETSLGGVYSRLASTFQRAVAHWLLRVEDIKIAGTKVELRIITGLDALSRNGDLAALRGALEDIGALQSLGPAADELNLAAVIKAIFMGHGVRATDYLATPEQKQARADAAAQQQAQASGLEAGAQRIARGN